MQPCSCITMIYWPRLAPRWRPGHRPSTLSVHSAPPTTPIYPAILPQRSQPWASRVSLRRPPLLAAVIRRGVAAAVGAADAVVHKKLVMHRIEAVLETKKVAHNANRVQYGAAGRHEEDIGNLVAFLLAAYVGDPDRVANGQYRLNARCYRETRVVIGHPHDVLRVVKVGGAGLYRGNFARPLCFAETY